MNDEQSKRIMKKTFLCFVMAVVMGGAVSLFQSCQDDLKDMKDDIHRIRELCDYVLNYAKGEVESGEFDYEIWDKTEGITDQKVITELHKYAAPQWLIDYVLKVKHERENREKEGE